MLIRFSVSNFLSFNKIQEFSMIGGKVRRKSSHLVVDKNIKLLKFTALYGANASGKSNLVRAIDFSRRIIVDGFPEMHTGLYHKMIEENKTKPSYFEFEIKIEDRYYSYGFEIILNSSSIVSEWLYEIMPDGGDKKIFTRDLANRVYDVKGYFKENSSLTRLSVYAEDIKSDDSALFLLIMNTNKSDLYSVNGELSILRDIFQWFKRQLDVNHPDKPISDYSYFITDKNEEEIFKIITAFGTGITKYTMIDISRENLSVSLPKGLLNEIINRLEKQKAENRKNGQKAFSGGVLLRSEKEFFRISIGENDEISINTLQFTHENSSAFFSLSEESDGTRRLLDLIEVLLSENSDKIYVIDEVDRCLHPQLTYKLIQRYLDVSKDSKRQLIVTAHESVLLDFGLLRRDEIWFVEKNTSGESTVYSLEEYNERFDKRIDKAYLEGRYGGVPIFSSVFPVGEKRDAN